MSSPSPDLLAHLVVGVAAHVSQGVAPRHLGATLACVVSWRRVSVSVALTVYTNERAATVAVVHSSLPPPSPPTWRASVSEQRRQQRRGNAYALTHSHLWDWAHVVANASSTATAFVHLEDDLAPSIEALRSWAHDEALLEASGAAAAGFQRGFYRYEVTRPASEMHWQRVRDLKTATASVSKYTAEFINGRAAAWRAANNVSLGERFILDERMPRRYKAWGCDARVPPCTPGEADPASVLDRQNASGGIITSSSSSATLGPRARTAARWCTNYPTLVVSSAVDAGAAAATSMARGPTGHRAFVALANPYSAITAAPRRLVARFLLASNGWNLSHAALDANSSRKRGAALKAPPRYRMRHKAYAVREYGSSTLHYAHEFLRFEHARSWPQGVPGAPAKHRHGMRRVLVPLVPPPPSAAGAQAAGAPASWRLDALAAVHHRSDRVVNGPRKGVEALGARLRESGVVRCVQREGGR